MNAYTRVEGEISGARHEEKKPNHKYRVSPRLNASHDWNRIALRYTASCIV